MASQGFKLSFANAKTKNALKPLSGQPPAKKPRLLDDDEPEDTNKSVEIAGWDANAGGAIDIGGKKEEKGPLVIPSLPNRNWMGQKKGQNGTHAPPGDKAQAKNGAEPEGLPEEQMQLGLNIIRKKSPAPQDGDVAMKDADAPAAPEDDNLTDEQRLEKRALEALMSGKDSAAEHHVIPAAPTEDDAFDHDYTTAPEAPSLDDYAAVPVEGFGAALLRGMGWKDGESIGRHKGQPVKQREVKRRPAGLGIGAKVEQAVDLEVAQWGKPKGKKGGEVPGYVPVVLMNKATGEKITEEELKERLERQKLVGDGDGDGEGVEGSGSGKSREKERRREKERYDDYETEEERRERKRREKEKDRERERRDRDRSPDRDDRRKDKYRDRDCRREDEYDSRDSRDRRDRDRRDRSRDRDSGRKERRRDDEYYSDRKRDSRRDYSDDDAKRSKRRDRSRDRDRSKRDRSRSPDSDDRRKRRRDYDDEDDGRKKKYRGDEYRRK